MSSEEGLSETAAADQSESEIVPVWPLVVVAVALLKSTVPKFASGSGLQLLAGRRHSEGASAIHSALETSGLLMLSVLLKEPPVVESDRATFTLEPLTVTCAEMW